MSKERSRTKPLPPTLNKLSEEQRLIQELKILLPAASDGSPVSLVLDLSARMKPTLMWHHDHGGARDTIVIEANSIAELLPAAIESARWRREAAQATKNQAKPASA